MWLFDIANPLPGEPIDRVVYAGSVEHNPLVESEDEVNVIRFNTDLSDEYPSGRANVNLTVPGEVRSDPLARYHRTCWLLLSFVSLIWGGISGAALALSNFPITPSGALLGALSLVVLALTLFRLGRATL